MQIFISYRRADSADVSGRIYDRLVAHFGRASVFKDVDSIPLGVDFRHYVDRQIQQCDVALVIIGQQWLGVPNDVGQRRLDDPNDNVLIEVEQAMQRDVPIIPVLVQGVAMPPYSQLPASIGPLAYRNAISIHPDPDFHRDVDRLIHNIEAYAPPVAPSQAVPPVVAPAPVSPPKSDASAMAPSIKTRAIPEQKQSSTRRALSLSSVVRNPALYVAIGGLIIFATNFPYAFKGIWTSFRAGYYLVGLYPHDRNLFVLSFQGPNDIVSLFFYIGSLVYILISLSALLFTFTWKFRVIVGSLTVLCLIAIIWLLTASLRSYGTDIFRLYSNGGGYLEDTLFYWQTQIGGTLIALISAIIFYRSEVNRSRQI